MTDPVPESVELPATVTWPAKVSGISSPIESLSIEQTISRFSSSNSQPAGRLVIDRPGGTGRENFVDPASKGPKFSNLNSNVEIPPEGTFIKPGPATCISAPASRLVAIWLELLPASLSSSLMVAVSVITLCCVLVCNSIGNSKLSPGIRTGTSHVTVTCTVEGLAVRSDCKGVQLASARAPTNWEPAGISIAISVFFAVAVAVGLFVTLTVYFNSAPVTSTLSSFAKTSTIQSGFWSEACTTPDRGQPTMKRDKTNMRCKQHKASCINFANISF